MSIKNVILETVKANPNDTTEVLSVKIFEADKTLNPFEIVRDIAKARKELGLTANRNLGFRGKLFDIIRENKDERLKSESEFKELVEEIGSSNDVKNYKFYYSIVELARDVRNLKAK